MIRIIAGKHRGRKIELRRVTTIRPTSGFARETMFNILSHGAFGGDNSPYLGKRVMDVFCGSGAFGLEALSRGAGSVIFVDNGRESLATARDNAERLGELGNSRFLRSDASAMPAADAPCSLIFLDPPYGSNLVTPTLRSLLRGNWIDADTLVVVEHDNKENPQVPDELEQIDQRRYGRASIGLYKLRNDEGIT